VKPSERRKGKLILADGTRFDGRLTGGGRVPVWGEVVFNTSMTGYQEIVTDPSYAGQIIVMTYPQIGNYGVHAGDSESEFVAARGLVVRELSPFFSPGPGRRSLEEFMVERGLAGLTDVDTRSVAFRIRSEGVVVGVIGSEEHSDEQLLALARSVGNRVGRGLVQSVSGKSARAYRGNGGRVAVVDFGVKNSIVASVRKLGVETVVLGARKSPAGDFDADSILAGNFDAVVISNGPGDPTDIAGAVESVRKLIGKIPVLGICLGHQVTALALGGATYKLKFGHRGANQPVVSRRTGRMYITSQNHGYAVSQCIAERDTRIRVTYTNLNDGTIEGFADEKRLIECVQFHPEASPGPHDTSFIFQEFFARVRALKTPLEPDSAWGDEYVNPGARGDACVNANARDNAYANAEVEDAQTI
jgi:carbamoyl-phosphate synthase small subunit